MCPQSLGEWAWVPFRNHCYAFNLQLLRLQDDAHRSCKNSMEASQKPHVSTSFIVQLVQLTTLNWKPIKYKSPVLVHGKHNWQNTSIILNLAMLSFSLGQSCSVSLVINSVWFHLCFFLFVSSSRSRTSLYHGWDREWICMGAHPELCRTGTWSLAGCQRERSNIIASDCLFYVAL